MLLGDSDGSARELFNIFGGTSLLGLFETLFGLGLALETTSQLTGLQLGWCAIEYIERFDSIVDHS